jgi:hypothetical protein
VMEVTRLQILRQKVHKKQPGQKVWPGKRPSRMVSVNGPVRTVICDRS